MKNESKKRLDEIFAAYQDNQAKKQQAHQVRHDAEAEFLSEFHSVVDSVIRPAFDEIGKYAESHGFKLRIDTQQDATSHDGETQSASISIKFPMSDERSYSALNGSPCLKFDCNKREKCIELYQNDIVPGRGGMASGIGIFKLDEMTAEFIHGTVADFLQKILLKL
jgi:hypothetical protein